MRSLLAATLLLTCALTVPAADAPKGKPKHTNRLSREISPYLLQHAHNPVNWFPWGEEAFAKAKKENKLVFLSIGYSSCHWCHVMEKESFADEEVAKLLNDHYVCIKVDREERPDIDQIYMTALNVLGNRGGWPLSMFLTAEGKPLIGGTYWPKEDRVVEGEKSRGFKSLLKLVQEYKKENPDKVKEQADNLASATTRALTGLSLGVAVLKLEYPLVTAVTDTLKEEFDREHGGFGTASRKFRGPKFPTPTYLVLLQHEAARTKAKDVDEMVQVTLDHMARGGIYDHLGGGFHRYSTERTWTVPHFEKMLYDNAQLLEVYARAFTETKKPLYRRVLRQTWAFIEREMTGTEGGFYSALDADSEGEEGRFYVWTEKDLNAVLTDKAEAGPFRKAYGVDGEMNFESKYFILTLPQPLAGRAVSMKLTEDQLDDKLALTRQKLFAARAKRPGPFLDTKVLTAWNGQMISGAALAGQALGDKAPVAAAIRAAEFLLKTMKTKDGRLLRTFGSVPGQKGEARLNGYLDDYAFLVHGLLTLHDVTKESRWLDEARTLTEVMVKFHGDEAIGGFYYTSNDHEKLFARAKDQYDAAQPSGNSVAARNLVRLWQKTGDARYGKLAEKTIKSLAAPLKSNPASLTTLAHALAQYLDVKKDDKK